MKKLLFSFASAGLVMALATNAAVGQTAAPSPQATVQPSPSASAPAPKKTAAPNKKSLLARLKRLLSIPLSAAQVKYAVTHQSQELAQLKKMKRVSYTKIRIYRLSPSMMKNVKSWRSSQAYEPFQLNDQLAQSSNPFLNIFANVVVTNALNNILNGNNVSVSLNDVLNANAIGIGQVVGLFINGAGIITTIVGS